MNKVLIILSFVLLTSCGPSAEEIRQAEIKQQQIEMERQRTEKEASEKLAQEKANRIAAVTCSIMSETRNMDSAVRVEKMNEARDKIGGEPFLSGDDAIKEALELGLCQELVLNETYDEILQSLKDAKRERERIAAEKRAAKQRIADSKPTVKEEFDGNGKLQSRTNYQSKKDGGKLHGLREGYYDNGQLLVKENYKDGEPDGLSEWYLMSGQLSSKRNYKDGKLDGLGEIYNYNGELKSASCYDNGEEVDISRCEK